MIWKKLIRSVTATEVIVLSKLNRKISFHSEGNTPALISNCKL
jgi:hypothetical protein